LNFLLVNEPLRVLFWRPTKLYIIKKPSPKWGESTRK